MSAPAKMTVVDEGVENGIEWATCKAPMYGAVNGYVKIPVGHPWQGLDYDEIYEIAPDLAVNGGLTYGSGITGWIGFDTLHAGDYWPGAPDYWADNDSTHWTPELVAAETRSLARQVAEATQ